MITLRRSVVVVFIAGSIYLAGLSLWSGPTNRAIPIAYAQRTVETPAEQEELIAGAEKLSRAFRAAARSVSPAVVRINALVRAQRRSRMGRQSVPNVPEEFRGFFGEDLFRQFEEQRGGRDVEPESNDEPQLQRAGIGSGVIVSSEGYVLTNNHVVENAEQIEVEISDGRKIPGTIVGRDDKSDIAVVKIDAKGLIAARVGDSSAMDVGDWVIAVGSPFELDQTVTAGIISATNRNVEILDYEDFLQTDAAINPGNSGGPLVNLRGEVIGINTAINSRTGSNAGVGFAIPSNMARLIMENLIENGKMVRGYIGASLATLTPDVAKEANIKDIFTRGVLVDGVIKDGPAAKAGLKNGDIIVSVNGEPVRTSQAVRNRVSLTKPGTQVRFGIVRDSRESQIVAKVEQLPDGLKASGQVEVPEFGLVLQKLTPSIARRLKMPADLTGAIVVEVAPTRGQPLMLQPYDVIRSINGKDIVEPDDVAKQLKQSGRRLNMVIQRGPNEIAIQSSR